MMMPNKLIHDTTKADAADMIERLRSMAETNQAVGGLIRNTARDAANLIEHLAASHQPIRPIRIDWNKHGLAVAYDLIEEVRRDAAQDSESPLDTSLRAALDAVEAADCEWDGLTGTT